MVRFETEILTQSRNLELLMNLAGDWVDRVHQRKSLKHIILYHSFRYRAASWGIPRRVVAKIEWHAGELFPRVGFIAANLRWKSSNVVKVYNKRGTAEQWVRLMPRIAEKLGFQKGTPVGVRQRNDNQWPIRVFPIIVVEKLEFLRQM